ALLTICLGEAGSVADQAAGHRELALLVDGRNGVARAARAGVRSRPPLKNGSAATRSAPGRACTIFAKAVSISVSLLASKIVISFPIARAPASDSRILTRAGAKFGFKS